MLYRQFCGGRISTILSKKCIRFVLVALIVGICAVKIRNLYYVQLISTYVGTSLSLTGDFFRTNTSGGHEHVSCKIPELNPFDPSISKYVSEYFKIHKHSCTKYQENLVEFVEYNGTRFMRLKGDKDAQCRFRCVRKSVDDEVQYDSWQPVKNDSDTEIDCDFNEVRCGKDARTVYEYVHAQIIPNRTLENFWQSFPQKREPQDFPTVLVMIIDSTSRSNFIRQLPDTYKFIINELGAIDFASYVKIGQNSFPNAMPLMAGLSSEEIEQLSNGWKTDCDTWPLIWQNFSSKQYATLLAEDMPGFGLFRYKLKGFRQQPTTHYMTPFWVAVEDSTMILLSKSFCYENHHRHKIHLDYCSDFLQNYDERVPKFGFCWISYFAHDSINTAGMADDDFLAFFKRNKARLENSFLFFISDHGNSVDDFRETPIGRLEASLPFLFFVAPKWFQKQYSKAYANLIRNAKERRLISTYDFHTTFVNLLHTNYDADNQISEKHGRSLFSDIPVTRTCPDAGIPSSFCVCTNLVEVSAATNFSEVRRAALAIVNQMNTLLVRNQFDKLCSTLTLSSIEYLAIISDWKDQGIKPNQSNPLSCQTTCDLLVRLRTAPSDGLFEGLVRISNEQSEIRVLGDIFRINRYGNQSACIQHKTMRNYCYCMQ